MEKVNDLKLLSDSIIDLKWFNKNMSELRKDYENKVIAIKEKTIVSSSSNTLQLLKNLEKKGVNSDIMLIKRVTPKGEIIIF